MVLLNPEAFLNFQNISIIPEQIENIFPGEKEFFADGHTKTLLISSWIPTNLWDLMEFIRESSKNWLMSPQNLSMIFEQS